MADFFAKAPAMEAPAVFTGMFVCVRFVAGVGVLVVARGGGGMKRLERSRSRRWRLARSLATVSSRDCRRFLVALDESWICLFTTAVIVFGGGGGISLASRRAVELAEFSRRCFEATRRMLRAIALRVYWETYATWVRVKHWLMISCRRRTSGSDRDMP